MKKAWKTTAMTMGITSVVSAETRGQAISRTVSSANGVGYMSVNFKTVRAVRYPERGAWAEVDESRCCWDEKYLPKI